jgi:hypothetical protein
MGYGDSAKPVSTILSPMSDRLVGGRGTVIAGNVTEVGIAPVVNVTWGLVVMVPAVFT